MITLEGKYTSATIYAETIEEGVYQQVYNLINCPAFEGQKVVCMPDVHVGASGPCGLVATIGNWICPEHIGVDIGCTVSMILLSKKLPEDKYVEFEHKIKQQIPSGREVHDKEVIDEKNFYSFLTTSFNQYRQYWPEMLMDLPDQVTEKWVSDQLKRIGINEGLFYKSLGTIGGGNHFIEYDENEDLAGISLHFGSRNFGAKVCKYWMNKANEGISNKEKRQLIKEFKSEYISQNKDMHLFAEELNKYLDSVKSKFIKGYLTGDLMKGYLCDMCFAQLYALYNHITVRKIIASILQKYNIKVDRIIASTHNFIDLHDHTLRKSAVRSYEGEELLVPFNMRDGIAICIGKSNSEWLNSCCHGAGRIMSRSAAKQNISLDAFKESMKGIYSTSVGKGTIDESPMAYKNTEEIKKLMQNTCDVRILLKPKISIKSTDEVDLYEL